jgi:hypothetical protein
VIDVRNVRAAERRVELRKEQVRERWDGLRRRGRDALLSPAALGAFALVGGVIGWRSARRSSESTKERNATQPDAVHSSSPAGSIFRGVASGLLQTIAAVAVEEALKSTITGGSGKTGAAVEH